MENSAQKNRDYRGSWLPWFMIEHLRQPRLPRRPRFLLFLIRLYQCCLSPWLGTNCRFTPSCSHYAAEALARHGPSKGGWLALRRLLRCRPLGSHGYDPVPYSPDTPRRP